MKVDEIFVLYKNGEKYFNSYAAAYFNSKKPCMPKTVYYVFTPTMQEFKRVGELENACRKYFNHVADCDYFDIITKQSFKQLKIIGEC